MSSPSSYVSDGYSIKTLSDSPSDTSTDEIDYGFDSEESDDEDEDTISDRMPYFASISQMRSQFIAGCCALAKEYIAFRGNDTATERLIEVHEDLIPIRKAMEAMQNAHDKALTYTSLLNSEVGYRRQLRLLEIEGQLAWINLWKHEPFRYLKAIIHGHFGEICASFLRRNGNLVARGQCEQTDDEELEDTVVPGASGD